MSAPEVRAATAGLASELRDERVTISVAESAVSTDLVRLGVRVDHDRVVSDAFAARSGGSLITGPLRWLSSFRTAIELDVTYVVDATAVEAAVATFIAPQLDGPKSPTLALVADRFVPTPGAPGTVVDPAQLVERIKVLIGTQGPYTISLTPYPSRPLLSLDAVGRVAVELNAATSDPLGVRVLEQSSELTAAELRTIIDIENTEDGSFWQVNQGRALELLRNRFDGLGDPSQQARFIVVQDRPEIVPAQETLVCCDDKTSALLRAALLTRPTLPISEDGEDQGGDPIRTVELSPIVTDGTKGVFELQALGIVELVSTFTTSHRCCENRVDNIQLFADTVRGTVIPPGEVLSFNALVGERTVDKGYKQAGAINLGSLEPQVGGGVSQAITTIFNAAFFAGLDFDDYQAHSLYFSRYPEGREATISWPRPDLKLRNDTSFGVLIWTEYTGTSITVSMYSTKHIEVEALPVVRRSQAQCRRVTTPRQRTYPSGRVVIDEVFAVYRPAQGLDCNGNPADPDAVPPTTTTTQPTTTQPATTQPTTTQPATTQPTTTQTTSSTTSSTQPTSDPPTTEEAPTTQPPDPGE
jgi:vancomycin resistance protein YoaR